MKRFTRLVMMEPEPFRVDDEKVIEVLDTLESDTLGETGVAKISGGYAHADIVNYDNQYFDVELKWGIQSDCENSNTTEYYKLDRLTLVLKDA